MSTMRLRAGCCVCAVLVSLLAPTSHASAEDSASVTYAARSPEHSGVNVRALRGGLAASAFGVVFSTVGIAFGTGYMFYSFSCPALGGPGNTCLEDGYAERDRRQKIGAVTISVSALGLGASIFGIVRTKRNLRAAHPKRRR